MANWFHEKKNGFYDWIEYSSIPAKAGAVILLIALIALLIFAPFFLIGGAAFIFVCWLLFALLESFG